MLRAKDKFSLTVIEGQVPRLGSWKTLLTIWVLLCSAKLDKLCLFNNTWPEDSFISPDIIFNKVDLPVPLLPMILTNSPSSISIDKFSKIVLGSPYGLGNSLKDF